MTSVPIHLVHPDDWGQPFCGEAVEGDLMWWFDDGQITCSRCRSLLDFGEEVEMLL